ncbi:hypothetical protein B0H10DRAFT_1298440 [Mycena sp. CBHHK59/15]|nr:hypothetical protein B0H10DRAFT_1298440 [Mycena sp. CBHHK59/15]
MPAMESTMDMPPTTHALPHTQRARLMRSTRKLGALLGETPHVVDSDSATPYSRGHAYTASMTSVNSTDSSASKRSGRIYASVSSGTRTSSLTAVDPASVPPLTVAAATGHEPPRPLLLLRLPSPASRPTSALPSPLTPTFAPNTPPAHDDAGERRRKKMAKLVRTLGQNVPPELVFPANSTKIRRRASTMSVPAPESPRTLSHATSYSSLAAPPPRAPSVLSNSSGSSDGEWVAVAPGPDRSFEYLIPPPASHGGTHRREQGWSGEWGGAAAGMGMDDVVKSLRGLRVK